MSERRTDWKIKRTDIQSMTHAELIHFHNDVKADLADRHDSNTWNQYKWSRTELEKRDLVWLIKF